MISSKDFSTSQRLKSSLDIFFLLGILLKNSVVAAALEVFSLVFHKSFSCRFEKTARIFSFISSVYKIEIFDFAYSVSQVLGRNF